MYFEREYLLRTGSFKERGARNALKRLSDEQKVKGAIAASAGNHAQALAYHGRSLNIPVTVVMPTVAPIVKQNNCAGFGANVVIQGNHIVEAKEYAMTHIIPNEGQQYINGYDDADIIAGQGTIGLEILDQVPDVDAIVVPVGGAGLIAGIALAVKTLRPEVEIIAVEAESCPSWSYALEAGQAVAAPATATLADGLAVPVVGPRSFEVAKDRVDRTILIKEKDIAIGIVRMIELEKALVEGGGVTGIAAVLAGKLPDLKGKKVVNVLCGGNVDTTTLGRVIERGLAADGRIERFQCRVSDRPGGIAELSDLVAKCGVSILDIHHERAWVEQDMQTVQIKMIVETRGKDHGAELKAGMQENGYEVVWGQDLC